MPGMIFFQDDRPNRGIIKRSELQTKEKMLYDQGSKALAKANQWETEVVREVNFG